MSYKTQIIIGNQYNPFLNLAVESSLLNNGDDDTVTMFLWKNHQTVVYGYNQNPFTECNVDMLLSEGGHAARRRTGGGAVYHDLGNLNFSFVAHKKHYDVRKQLEVIQTALGFLGLETEISGRNDLTYDGRKFSGNAFGFYKERRLHHGTILIKTDTEKLTKYLKVNPAKLQKHGVKSVASRIINLSEVVDITSDTIIPHLTKAFEQVYEIKPEIVDFNDLLTSNVLKTRDIFASDEYLFGKWRNFHAKKSAQFLWGLAEIDLHINEEKGIIENISIASDGLEPELIEETERILTGASIKEMPDFGNNEVARDIAGMIY
ncbi:MAG: lipoate--protein ligase [Bacteroidales bacterium]|nr:lipoate--protein ligase [Bacteroidales bacterium]